MSRRRTLIVVAAAVTILVGIALVGTLVLTRTDWGRERMRGFALDRLRSALDAQIEIGALEGNLLDRVRFIDVEIRDLEGRPFVSADTIESGFSLRALLRRRIVLEDVRLVQASIVVDEPPGEAWNFTRILPIDTVPDGEPGWGDWILLRDVELDDVRVTIRSEWDPETELTPEERGRGIREALIREHRSNVQRVPGGLQNVLDFRGLAGRMPLLRIADPEHDAILAEVARLSGTAQPFKPPAAEVLDLAGEFRLSQDSLWFSDARARMPGSRVTASGAYHLKAGHLLLDLRGAPVAMADLRWLYPHLPQRGGGDLLLRYRETDTTTSVITEDMDVRVDDAHVTGAAGVTVGDGLRRLHDTDLAFEDVDTRLLESVIPAFEAPRHGRLTGRLALEGRPADMRVDGDVAFVDDVAGRSRVTAAGSVDMEDEVRFRDLRLRFDPLQTDLLRDRIAELPAGATLVGPLRLDGSTAGVLQVDGDLRVHDPASGTSRVAARGGLDLAGPLQLRALHLRFAPLRLDLVRGRAPELPAGATVAGELRLDGPPDGLLDVDGSLTVDDPETGVSRIAANGGIAVEPGIRFRDLDVRMEPLQLALVSDFEPSLPVGGTLEGTAILTGAPGAPLDVRGDVVHREGGERSRIAGTVELRPGDRAHVDVRLRPLSLVTAGRFVPGAGLHGEVSGSLVASGRLGDLAVRADLTAGDGGRIAASGTLDLASPRPGYDLDTRVRAFDLAAVTHRAPAETRLTGAVTARGRGLELATMDARIDADLADPRVDGVHADSVRLRLTLESGLAVVDSSLVRLGAAEAWLDGSFGLVPGRSGALSYVVTTDSLGALQPLLPLPAADTAGVEPRPAVRRAALEEARAEARRRARAWQVERLATGRAPPPPDLPDTLDVAAVPRDSLAGSLHAAGTLRGNVSHFDLTGRAEAEELVVLGSYVSRGRADYRLLSIGTDRPAIELDAATGPLLVEGYAFDSVAARIEHRGADRIEDRGLQRGTGRAVLSAWQDDAHEYHADLGFTLAADRGEVRLHDVALRFDTVRWESTGPGTVRWAGDGLDLEEIEVEGIELASRAGGRIFLDGLLPVDGEGDLRVVLDGVQLRHLLVLAQEDADATGLVSLDARVRGTLQSPRLAGDLALTDATHEGRELPDVRASVEYAATELALDATLRSGAEVVATVEGTVPIDLALAGRAGPRLLDGPLDLDVRADRLRLDGLPIPIRAVSGIEGHLDARVSVRGTVDEPVLDGRVRVEGASARVDTLGVRFEEIAGAASLDGRTLALDSLVAWSGGPVRVTGEIDLRTPTEPAFDLRVVATRATVLDTEDGTIRISADLAVEGPFDGVRVTGVAHTRGSVVYAPEGSEKELLALDEPVVAAPGDTLFTPPPGPPPSPLLANLVVDVDLHVDETWLRSTDMNIELYTAPDLGPMRIHLDRAAGSLALTGTINAERGDYIFMGRRFEVATGSATFLGRPGLNPLLELTVEHEVHLPGREPVDIQILIGGTADAPRFTIESTAEPPLSETELLGYIAFGPSSVSLIQQEGSTLSGESGLSGNLVGNVAALATQQMAGFAVHTLLDEFESETARSLGVDVFRISAADLPAELFTGRFEDVLRGTEIEIGSYIGPRLFAAGITRPTFETLPGARLEYRAANGLRWRLSWEARFLAPTPTFLDREFDRTNALGAFLSRRWRF